MLKFQLSEPDLSYISSQINLSLEKTKILTEEERDLDLLIEQIVKKPLAKAEILKLSFFIYVKLIVFRFARETDFSLEDKSYIAGIIHKYFPKMKKKEPLVTKKNAFPENIAGACLIGVGLTCDSINDENRSILEQSIEQFANCGKKSISDNCEKWMEILQSIRKKKLIYID